MCPGSTNPFDTATAASSYDAWFDSEKGSAIFRLELACLAKAVHPHPGRWLEIGVGTGRFAAALGITDGVEPAEAMRKSAEARGIRVVAATGESLPYAAATFDGALLTTALCFLSDPSQALKETFRVLKQSGILVLGIIPADSAWGRLYQKKAANGHALYACAAFRRVDEVIALAGPAGWAFHEAFSCLLASPEQFTGMGEPQAGVISGAGYVVLVFIKRLDRVCPLC